MSILMWDKPKKAMSTEEWLDLSACAAPPGVYTPNMSDADAKKWRAKLTGHKSGHPQVEIRTSAAGSQLLVIVSLQGRIKYKHDSDRCNIRISTNGPLLFSFATWLDMQQAIKEAQERLAQLK